MAYSLKADLKRYYMIEGGSERPPTLWKIRILIESYGLHAIAAYRVGNYIDHTGLCFPIRIILILIYNVLNWVLIRLYGININRKATVGEGLYIGHFGGIEIDMANINRNVSIHQNVSIGTFGKNNPCEIGKNVWIGPHAKISRGVLIGDGATIAAGAIVCSNVKNNCLVIGNPARSVRSNYDNSHLLCLPSKGNPES